LPQAQFEVTSNQNPQRSRFPFAVIANISAHFLGQPSAAGNPSNAFELREKCALLVGVCRASDSLESGWVGEIGHGRRALLVVRGLNAARAILCRKLIHDRVVRVVDGGEDFVGRDVAVDGEAVPAEPADVG